MMLGPFGSSVIQQCPLWLAFALFACGAAACLPRRRPAVHRAGRHRRCTRKTTGVAAYLDEGITWRAA